MQHYTVILNPIAGKGNAQKKEPFIKNFFESQDLSCRIVETERVWHAAEIAQECSENGTTVVIAAGGDGTCNEVINGLMLSKKSGKAIPALGVLPVGRGNDFCYGMGVPEKLEEALGLFLDPHKDWIDVGEVRGGFYPQGRFFGNGMGVGFDTMVGIEAAKIAWLHGFMAYVAGALKSLLFYYRAPHIRILLDQKNIDASFLQISIMNGKRMGGTFFMAPQAKRDDGIFNLCMVGPVKRLKMLKIMARYTKGTQTELPEVSEGEGANITLAAPEGGMVVHADGETICLDGTQLEINCLSHQIEMVVPA